LAALALAVFAVPEAHGEDGPSLDLRLAGSIFVTSSTDEGRPTEVDGLSALTALANGIAKGSGGPLFTAQTIVEPLPENPADYPPECLALDPPQAGAGLSTTTVFTYNDGSLLTITTDPEISFYCTNGVVFIVEFGGMVAGGTGRFEGATGTWEGTAEATGGGTGRLTAHNTIDLD
jgi:hypothetical protein